jgi:predicted nucleotide-binding protein
VDLNEVRRLITEAGLKVATGKRLGNDTGTQLRLTNKAIVNVFHKGTMSLQGTNTDIVKAALGAAGAAAAGTSAQYTVKRKVFVVYGHDKTSRDQLEAMLRRWGLEPLILDQLPTEGQTVIEKLEAAMAETDFGIVLATPDDKGHRVDHADEISYRARQNVVLELGMLLAQLGRQNVAILLKAPENMERPSDIQGLIYIPFKDDLAKEVGVTLAKTMVARQYKIDVAKL